MTVTEVSGSVANAPVSQQIDGAGPVPASLLLRVHLTKQEVFAACQALADADPVLVAAGGIDQARALADLFERLEDRLTGPRAQAATMYAPAPPDRPVRADPARTRWTAS